MLKLIKVIFESLLERDFRKVADIPSGQKLL
jgi:hypothetical protein